MENLLAKALETWKNMAYEFGQVATQTKGGDRPDSMSDDEWAWEQEQFRHRADLARTTYDALAGFDSSLHCLQRRQAREGLSDWVGSYAIKSLEIYLTAVRSTNGTLEERQRTALEACRPLAREIRENTKRWAKAALEGEKTYRGALKNVAAMQTRAAPVCLPEIPDNLDAPARRRFLADMLKRSIHQILHELRISSGLARSIHEW